MRKKLSKAKAEKLVADFNATHAVGAPVFYWPGVREGQGKQSKTRSEAYLAFSGDPVVFVEGYSSYIALTHIQPILS